MKYIRFSMRNKKDDFTLPMPKAEQILQSAQQTVMVADESGNWTGLFVNKADIMKTDRDYESEREWNLKNTATIEEPVQNPITDEHRAELNRSVKKLFQGKRV